MTWTLGRDYVVAMRRQVIFSFEVGPKEQFDGTIEQMYNDPDSPLRKHLLGDFDIESYQTAGVKIDFFKNYWESPQLAHYYSLLILRCLNDPLAQDDTFTFYSLSIPSGWLERRPRSEKR
jgi:hypothetical protein